MSAERALGIAMRVVDVLIAVVFVSVVANAANTWPVYIVGDKLLAYHFKALFWLLVVRSASVVPWQRFPVLPPIRIAAVVVAGIVYLLFLHTLILTNFYSAVVAVMHTRAAFKGATDAEIAIDITEHNKWYPRMSFVIKVQELVPEDAAIAYIGDQRPHIMSYLLYPRRVYALPEMQTTLNQSIQDNWTWSHLEDPFHKQEDPQNPRRRPTPPDLAPERIQAEMRRMIAERKIEWVLYYDSLYTDKSFIERVDPATLATP